MKEETKLYIRQCPVSLAESKIREGSPNESRKSMEDFWNRWVLSLEWKADGGDR